MTGKKNYSNPGSLDNVDICPKPHANKSCKLHKNADANNYQDKDRTGVNEQQEYCYSDVHQ